MHKLIAIAVLAGLMSVTAAKSEESHDLCPTQSPQEETASAPLRECVAQKGDRAALKTPAQRIDEAFSALQEEARRVNMQASASEKR